MSSRHKKKTRGVNKTGRDAKPEKFVMHRHYVLRCEAYRSMKALPRAVYMELRRRFNGSNNGKIVCSIREIVRECNCSKDAASAALKELQEKGFIKCTQKGSFHFKVPHAAMWALTEEELDGALPTKEFMRWKQPAEKCGPKSRTRGPSSSTDIPEEGLPKSDSVLVQGPPNGIEDGSRS